ncbi:MAG TPA: apolipoprotein N-acyltransferase [Pseudomonadales bacterium]|nr:apolipoprotein N-acyltransferase [Pseudomonadales bacterium]
MPQLPAENPVPLIVDLDGTLIKTDVMWESLALRLRRNPLAIFVILFWWTRGRAFLKKQLGKRAGPDPATLPQNEKFLAWLHEQKKSGRKIILATASDMQMARPVADYFGIFDDVMASDGQVNLRSENKLKALVARYGEKGFDYAGNSSADVAVWRGSRKAIVVNASRSVQEKAKEVAEVAIAFCDANSSLATLKRFLNELFLRSGYLFAVLAGLLLAAAFPKVDFAGGAWIAPGLLAFAAQNKRGGDAFLVGVLAGLTFWLASLYWLLEIPYQWHSIPLGPGVGWLALTTVLSLFAGTWTWLISDQERLGRFWAGRFIWALAGAAAWVALEMVRARLLGGFPWNFLGASQFKMIPLIQIASVTGVYGVSFLVVWTSLSFYSAVRMVFATPHSRFAWQPEIFPPLLAVAILFALGEIKLSAPVPATTTIRVALIQPSIPQDLIWDESANSNRFQQLLRLSEGTLTNQPDLLAWPESGVPDFDNATYTAITNLTGGHHVWLIFNGDDVVPHVNATNKYDNDYFNAAFLAGPDGRLRFDQIYHKQKLVMFGEYIPLVKWLPFIKWFTPITGGYTPGSSAVKFDLESLQVTASPLICYEDLFPQTGRKAAANGADFLINLTNDGWFGQSAEQWQHEMGSIFRAIENGIPLVRCCNNGVTCWIDSSGRQHQIFRDDSGSIYGPGALVFDLPIKKHQMTFYTRYGDWFGWSCVGVALVLLGFKTVRR